MRINFRRSRHDAHGNQMPKAAEPDESAAPAQPMVRPWALYRQINTLERHQRNLCVQQHALDVSKRHQNHLEHLSKIPEAALIEEVADARRETNRAFFDAFLGNQRGVAVTLLSAGTIPLGVWFMRKSARWKHAEKALLMPDVFMKDVERARSIAAVQESKVKDLQALVKQNKRLKPSR